MRTIARSVYRGSEYMYPELYERVTKMEDVREKQEDIGLQNREKTEDKWQIETILGIVLVW
jgi:hypothetical protein